jgi:type I restriction enzyme M protein
MLDSATKNKINAARDILVGKIPDPKGQIDQITNALIYKFMDDQDQESISIGGVATHFVGDLTKYAWHNLFDPKLDNQERSDLYREGLDKLAVSSTLPEFFRDVFKNTYLPFRDAGTISMFIKQINEFEYRSE